MASFSRKIINDPVHGFITVSHPLIQQVIAHPYYQRLRRIYQMALAHLVYPGAVHTRLHHSLGAYHLMNSALTELCSKGVEITEEEQVAAKAAILLHDIGHGPFSHALENILLRGVHHETMSLKLMHSMNEQLGGKLTMAIDIFTDKYPKRFLHQLISGQLDVDRMDYLSRDSFFTGVSEGVIGYDRILKMLVVHNGELMIEEKGIFSVEKFLVARRLMYWQVYLHKTVLAAEKMMVKIIERVRYLTEKGDGSLQTHTPIDFFLHRFDGVITDDVLEKFCQMDDYDFMHAIKMWRHHPDTILKTLCTNILDRKLLKVRLQADPINESTLQQKIESACQKLNITQVESGYLAFTGETINTMYTMKDERINILFKNGQVKDISQVDNALIHKTMATPVKKFYICFYE
ncbi:HD domain-containing protein [Aridibaculum aurantiacum]|uniref:HD domain-containing protein n=1 Tax=Aridibaculum aurantiacum TaxID=2810307 RepID=UPI001A95B0C2|nr:HD domain-containing protein [Aridibaculum aurantiacum]